MFIKVLPVIPRRDLVTIEMDRATADALVKVLGGIYRAEDQRSIGITRGLSYTELQPHTSQIYLALTSAGVVA